ASVGNADADLTTLFAESSLDKASHRLGVTRNRQGVVDARVDSQKVSGLSQLARLMPVQVLHPGTVQLIEGGPGDRRRYLDWLMFHRSEEHTSELQSRENLVCRLLLEKKK